MVDLKYIGHSAFEFKKEDKAVLVDPLVSTNEKFNWHEEPITDILLTHAHGDHLGEAIEIAREKDIEITAVFELANYCKAQGVKVKPVGLGSWINTNRNIVSGLYPLADQTKLSNIEEGAEKNFIRSVNTEQFTVNTEGKLDLAQNYVLTSLYRAEVGNLDDLVRAEGGEGNTTIVDEINYINERLQWQTINE